MPFGEAILFKKNSSSTRSKAACQHTWITPNSAVRSQNHVQPLYTHKNPCKGANRADCGPFEGTLQTVDDRLGSPKLDSPYGISSYTLKWRPYIAGRRVPSFENRPANRRPRIAAVYR